MVRGPGTIPGLVQAPSAKTSLIGVYGNGDTSDRPVVLVLAADAEPSVATKQLRIRILHYRNDANATDGMGI